MKATIDLPRELALRLKITAASRGKRMKAVAAETFRTALVLPAPAPARAVRHRVKLPLIVAPPGAPNFSLTGEDIDRLLMEDEVKSHHDIAGH